MAEQTLPLLPETTGKNGDNYHEVATAAAKYAATGWVSKRRGMLPSDSNMLILFDNFPAPERQQQLEWLMGQLGNAGLCPSLDEWVEHQGTLAMVLEVWDGEGATEVDIDVEALVKQSLTK
jgi:hypothetical protein